jgi:putative ABC transport system permease protein
MSPTNYPALIFKNSLRNRRRSLLTITSIAVSLCLLGILLALYRSLFYGNETTPAQALRLITRHRVSLTQPMPISYMQKVSQVPGVKALMSQQWFGGVYKDARDTRNFFARFAIEPNLFLKVIPDATISPEQQQAFESQRTGCIASKTLADKFGWKLGERITLTGDIFDVTLEMTLVGIFDDPDQNEILYFNREYLRELLPAGDPNRDMVGTLLIQADSAEHVGVVAKAIDAMFDNSPAPTKTESEREFQLSFISFLGNIKLFLMAICGAVTFTILLVSANTLAQSVRERTREIGVLKTLGFTSGNVLGIILGESIFLTLVGGAIGCAAAAVICWLLSTGPAAAALQMVRFLSVTPLVALITLGIAALIGLVSALIPAISAARTPILDSLRHSG